MTEDKSVAERDGAPCRAAAASSPVHPRLGAALARLKELHSGWAGVADVVDCGPDAIAPLRDLLRTPDPSGLFELRRRAIAALTNLGAYDVLIEFLSAPNSVSDPTAKAGEEAVISAAARALGGLSDERAAPLLVRLAAQRPLLGVIAALGAFDRPAFVPALVHGLYEDETRGAASAALARLGRAAAPALLRAATLAPAAETVSNLRARRAAAALLAEIGVAAARRPAMRRLTADDDPEIRLHACRALLRNCAPEERPAFAARLADLIPKLTGAPRLLGERALAELAAAASGARAAPAHGAVRPSFPPNSQDDPSVRRSDGPR